MRAELPVREPERLEALRRYEVLDTPPEAAYDDIALVAAHVTGAPLVAIGLLDGDREWFKARIGLSSAELPRDQGLAAHAILNPHEGLHVPDATKDPRLADNPLVTGDPGIRFCFGAPLVAPDGHPLGALCAMDPAPRELSAGQVAAMTALARQVVALLELRRCAADLATTAADRDANASELLKCRQQIEEAGSKLRAVSETDPLTGLGNRSAFDRKLAEEMYRSARFRSPLSILLIDVDKFKAYNDSHGHAAGDAVLQVVGRLLSSAGRPSDTFVRFSGQEFAVILPETPREGACAIAERLRKAVVSVNFAHRPVTVSIGAATLAKEGQEAISLIQTADRALTEAKRSGRNRVVHDAALAKAASTSAAPSSPSRRTV